MIRKRNSSGLACSVGQLTVKDVDHDGGKIHVILRNGDDVMMGIK